MMYRFLLILMGILFFSTNAQAALVSDTVGKWQVNFIERKGKVEPYCAAANLYTNKTILIMAFGTDGSGSIAFNFQQPSFEKGKVYPIHLSFPDGVTGRFDAKADSDQAVIIKTGKDSPLWQNMQNNVQMTLVVPPLERVFSLTSFPTVYQGLRTCLQDNTGTTLPTVQMVQKPLPKAVPVSPMETASVATPMAPLPTTMNTVSPQSTSAVPAMPAGLSAVQMPEPTMAKPVTSRPIISSAPVTRMMVENTSAMLSKPLLHLLNQSGVVLAKEGQQVFEDTGYIRQEWNTVQGYRGKFEQVYWEQGKRFHDLAQAYLKKRGLDCKGDYMPMGEEPYRVEDTAIAIGKFFCMEPSGSNRAAAVTFFAVGNTFSAVEHEAHFDALENLINIRENMVGILENMSAPKFSQGMIGSSVQGTNTLDSQSMGQKGRTVKFVAPSLPLNLYSN